MTVKPLAESDLDQFKEMMRYAFFRSKMQDFDLFLETKPPTEFGVCLYEGDRILSGMLLLPFEILWDGLKVPMIGYGGVTSLPEYRYQGYIGQLLIEGLRIIRERKVPFSHLMPFKPSFYHRYGWGRCFDRREFTVNIEALKQFGDRSLTFRPLTMDDISALSEVYLAHIAGTNGALYRSDFNWNYNFKWWNRDSATIEIYGGFDSTGKLQAYAVFQIEDRILRVNEWAYASPAAKRELYRFVYYHNAQIDKAVLLFKPDENPLTELIDFKGTYQIQPYMMSRVVDVQMVLDLMRPIEPMRGTFTLRIDDPITEWNNGVWRIDLVELAVNAETESNDSPDVQCSINAFSMICMGYIGWREAADMGDLKLNHPDCVPLLDSLFPRKSTLLMDFF